MAEVATGPGYELRCGRWQDVLADVEQVDAVITDPPYSERTHSSHRHMPEVSRRPIGYEHITDEGVGEFCGFWTPRCGGWFCVQTSHDLMHTWQDNLTERGFYSFAPIACVRTGSTVRLSGDGPANWTIYTVVARPRSMRGWGALPGAYVGTAYDGGSLSRGLVVGGKPLWLMRAIVRDYTRPGDLVCDPCAGGGTTLLAAVLEGRRAIGAEMDPETFRLAAERLERETRDRIYVERPGEPPRMKQQALELGGEP